MTHNLPVLSSSSGLEKYLDEIKQFPYLSADEEFNLAKKWRDEGDVSAAHRLVTSHLRLVAKIAMKYRGYGLPIQELIAEGNIGLMQAVKRFEPDKGFKLATYAMWWIKASIQEFILRSWSLVKIGSSAAQKRLFFNLRKLRGKITDSHQIEMRPEHVKQIANQLQVSEEEVVDMNRRLASGGDQSLNQQVGEEGENEWIDMLAEPADSHDNVIAENQEYNTRSKALYLAMDSLNDREKAIIIERRLSEEPATLEELSQKYGISRERVRQIEARAIEKLQKNMLSDNA